MRFKKIFFIFLFFSSFILNNSLLQAEETDEQFSNSNSVNKSKTEAKFYYLDGIYNYAKRFYQTSAENFEELTKNYPYSKYTRNSLILEAYTSYINKDYEKIEGIFAIYQRLFLHDRYDDYMMFIRGMTYYRQVRNEQRSSDFIENSLDIFTQLVQKYPDSKFSKDVEVKILYLKKLQQFSELSIGEFYYKTDNYISAMRIYTGILQKYKDEIVPEIEERTLCRIVETSKSLEIESFTNYYSALLKEKYPDTICLS